MRISFPLWKGKGVNEKRNEIAFEIAIKKRRNWFHLLKVTYAGFRYTLCGMGSLECRGKSYIEKKFLLGVKNEKQDFLQT
jgi:hypothetical protein